ncbi:MAG: cation-binding protein [Deltaproteobacteria bacterium]|nr:cation-binding protein [Deltaproteobacteria bacterium]
MNVIEPLMEEHRVIKDTLAVFNAESAQIMELQQVDLFAIETSIDFIRTYTDLVHHGKEENILFREIQKKSLADNVANVMKELMDEHKYARGIVRKWMATTENYFAGKESSQGTIDCLQELAAFYPRHIGKEDNLFFKPILQYFTPHEQDDMIREFADFEHNVLGWKYRKLQTKLQERLDSIGGASA